MIQDAEQNLGKRGIVWPSRRLVIAEVSSQALSDSF